MRSEILENMHMIKYQYFVKSEVYVNAKMRLHRGYDFFINFMKASKESRRHQRKMEIGARARRIKISCSLEFNGGSLLRNHAAMKKAYRSSRQGQ